MGGCCPSHRLNAENLVNTDKSWITIVLNSEEQAIIPSDSPFMENRSLYSLLDPSVNQIIFPSAVAQSITATLKGYFELGGLEVNNSNFKELIYFSCTYEMGELLDYAFASNPSLQEGPRMGVTGGKANEEEPQEELDALDLSPTSTPGSSIIQLEAPNREYSQEGTDTERVEMPPPPWVIGKGKVSPSITMISQHSLTLSNLEKNLKMMQSGEEMNNSSWWETSGEYLSEELTESHLSQSTHNKSKTQILSQVSALGFCVLEHGWGFPMVSCTRCQGRVCLDCHMFLYPGHIPEMGVKDAFTGKRRREGGVAGKKGKKEGEAELYQGAQEGNMIYTYVLKSMGQLMIDRHPIYVERRGNCMIKYLLLKLLEFEGQRYVLKTIIGCRGVDTKQLLDDELRNIALMSANHKLCLGVHKISTCATGSVIELTMNYFGPSLAQLISLNPFPLTEKQMIALFRKLALGISKLHRGKVFIGGLNVDLILYDQLTWEIKFLSLSQAVQFRENQRIYQRLTPFECIRGWVGHLYHSPELLKAFTAPRGDNIMIIPGGVDLYAFGLIFYQLITQTDQEGMEKLLLRRKELSETKGKYKVFREEILRKMLVMKKKNMWRNSMNLIISLIMKAIEYEPHKRMTAYHCYLYAIFAEKHVYEGVNFKIPSDLQKYSTIVCLQKKGNTLSPKDEEVLNKYSEISELIDSVQRAHSFLGLDSEIKHCTRSNNSQGMNWCEKALIKSNDIFGEMSENSFIFLWRRHKLLGRMGRYEDCANDLLKVHLFAKQLFPHSHPKIANILLHLGCVMECLGQFEKAEKYFIQALRMEKLLSGGVVSGKRGEIYSRMGARCEKESNHESTYNYLRHSIEIQALIHGVEDQRMWSDLLNLGIICHELGLFSEAYKYLKLRVYLSRNLKPTENLLQALRWLSKTSVEMGRLIEAKTHYLSFISLMQAANKEIKASCYWNLARVFFYLGEIKEAQYYMRMWMKRLQESKSEKVNDIQIEQWELLPDYDKNDPKEMDWMKIVDNAQIHINIQDEEEAEIIPNQ